MDEIPLGGLKGRVYIVTGANSGLGFSSVYWLASRGANVYMGCRSEKRCDDAAERIRQRLAGEQSGGIGTLTTLPLDLSSFKSVREFARRFLLGDQRLDGLMLNAGIMHPPYGLTADGIEQQIGVNHFGHFYLTRLLLPMMRLSATKRPATIVVVSSSAHYRTYDHGVGTTLAQLNDEEAYDPISAYGQSKLANVLFAQELARRERGSNVLVNVIHPGVVDTELARFALERLRNYAGDSLGNFLTNYVFVPLSKAAFWSSDEAALTQVYALVGPQLLAEKTTGKYFHPIARPNAPHSVYATDKHLQRNLWALSESIVEKFEASQKKR
eukprot:CAMPEP_0119121746 /NCGR_PEP_ID=MMETSP1310-20130426/2232_1 /TAXON_ID=464262 /ORGANISM="Genus nov. species nov., Strain RCC2339" /LENGTH=326 /DNA_ID=CAMNT_0007111323 /DNA_START=231 /DNA_END=1211 /DNA_ORIENTATION=-